MEVEKKMKRMLSAVIALAMLVSMTTVAFAESGKKKDPNSGIAQFEDTEVSPGETIEVDTDWFYGKWTISERDSDGKRIRTTYDTEDEPIGSLDKEYHKVSASWNRGGDLIENVYFEDGDAYVSVEIKGGISSVKDQDISGTIKITQKNVPNMPDVTFECKIERGRLTVKGIDEKSRMVDYGDKEFGLPYDYQEKQVRFSTEDGADYGTFIGEFQSERNGADIAKFQVRIIDQASLYLGFSESTNNTLAKKYPDADLRFINWTARPTFAREGKLSIYMYPDEYIYGINDDNSLYRLGGTYDEANDAYVITTKTLGSYVISDTQLTASGSGSTGGGTTSGSSVPVIVPSSASPKPSSSVAPPPSSSAPKPSSSVAPPPSSSAAPPPSSSSVAPPPSSSSEESSSEPEEESSDPEEDDEESSKSSSKKDKDKDKKDDDDEDDEDEDKDKEKKGFPLVPVLLGVLGIVIIVCAVVVVGNRNTSSRSRRRRYDDDWDD